MSLFSSKRSFTALLLLHLLVHVSTPATVLAASRHVIDFRSPNLFPEGIAWDPTSQRFLVGSLHHRTISAVSRSGEVQTLISDTSLPENVSIFGLAVDPSSHRVLAAIYAIPPLPPFTALAAYDLRSVNRLFLSLLPSSSPSATSVANDVALDSNGNAYVTNSGGNFIWKVNKEGSASIFSDSPIFSEIAVDPTLVYSSCSLNGIAYVSDGYFIVGQSNTGKIYKVDAEDGTATRVDINADLMGADGIAVREDGVVLVVSPELGKLWFLKSNDSWGHGEVFDEIALDLERFPTTVALREKDRAYVLYGRVREGASGNSERENFGIEEVRSEKENGSVVYLYVMIGFGVAYFLYWRFQMGRLAKNMDKKIN
ncbi:hypothetical protein RIF29_30713 [Crotalaria pallida]|uniref:SMP-30/Gluconolactonase/LRE-like region domain-containing protein n=1 Tax=Crotalaria pallida TaxID=3830 RepID=A0AAN9HX54_CROPI